MEDPKAMKKAAQRRGITNFSQSILDMHSYGIVQEGNTQKFAQNSELYLALKGIVSRSEREVKRFPVALVVTITHSRQPGSAASGNPAGAAI